MSYLISILILSFLMITWVFIQQHWKETFREEVKDEDALAGRSDCGSCGCGGQCANRQIKTDQ